MVITAIEKPERGRYEWKPVAWSKLEIESCGRYRFTFGLKAAQESLEILHALQMWPGIRCQAEGQEVLEGAVVVELKETISRVNDLLNDRNRANIGGSLGNLNAMLAEDRPKV